MISGQQKLIRLCVTLGSILIIIGAYVWWTKIYTNAENIFWGAFANNLATSSVTRTISDGPENSDAANTQAMQLQLGGNNVVYSTRKNADGLGNSVTTESITTPTESFIRLTNIRAAQHQIDASKLSSVVNVWAKDDTPLQQGIKQDFLTGYAGNLPSLPIANLDSKTRGEIVAYAKEHKAFSVDFKDVKATKQDGRSARTYTVKINPEGYVGLLKLVSQKVGTNHLADVDPVAYRNQEPLTEEITIDTLSRRVLTVKDSAGGYSETYSAYGVPVTTAVPSKGVITTSELQNRLGQLLVQ